MNTDTNESISIPEIGRVDVSSIISDAAAGRNRHGLRDVATRLGFDPEELATEAAAELADGD